jgi:hypothetical protein
MAGEKYLLSSGNGPCPDLLLVNYGSLLKPLTQQVVTANKTLVANASYHVHAETPTPIDLTLPACTKAGDQIILDVAPGEAPIKIVAAGVALMGVPAPNPQVVIILECNGQAWRELT